MFTLRSNTSLTGLPEGFVLDSQTIPSSRAINRLLVQCKEAKHSPEKFQLACKKSLFHLSIFEESDYALVGFVRATSDHGLNANLWDLVAEPGVNQQQFLSVLVYKSLEILRRKIPGCSISISAPLITFQALEDNGFLLNPNGIRAMGLRLV